MESITNNEAIELREIVRNAHMRRQSGIFVVEGPHLVQSALDEAPKQVQTVLITGQSKTEAIVNQATQLGIEVRGVTQRKAERIADTRTTQGVFAVVRIPRAGSVSANSIVALDSVQDPGNVGTIIRTASWFGIQHILTGPGTADCYSSKVVRATQGSIFNLNIDAVEDIVQKLNELKRKGYSIIGASLSRRSKTLGELTLVEKYVLVLGSEAHGINPMIEAECTTLVTIPRIGKGESLNVAVSAGVILAKLTQQN